MNKFYERNYYDLKKPSSYNGSNKFFKYLKERKSKKTLNQVQNWLKKQPDINLHKPLRKKFVRNKVIVYGIDYLWQADLVDVSSIAQYNNGICFLLTVIDVFSNYAWIEPLKNKSAESIVKAFKKIFKTRKPKKLQTDKGKEFLNLMMKRYLKENYVHQYQTNSEMKASVIERFNRTIKDKMWRYFTKNKTLKFVTILTDLINSYNNTFHRSIKMKPTEVTKFNEKIVFENLYGDSNDMPLVDIKFKKNDLVRISKYKTIFEKGYTPNWTKEIFKIYKIRWRVPIVYELIDFNNELIEGIFYEQELQKVYKLD